MRYAGTHWEVFDPEKLLINKDGLILHRITSHEHLKIGSFDTNLACELAENLSQEDGRWLFTWHDGTEYTLHEAESIEDY